MSEITKSGIVLTHGPNGKREPGHVHEELHAPCGCAFHERPAPHWHPCPKHAAPPAGSLKAVVWPGESRTNFEDDLFNKVGEFHPVVDGVVQCPLCGVDKPHSHTAQEVIIYRNGVRRGRAA